MRAEVPVTVSVPGGPRLEGRLTLPPTPAGGLVLCHPHPLYGGDMDNAVVTRSVEAAWPAGLATLRLNFRGVGGSGGAHGGGEGEQDDAAAALTMLRERLPAGRPLGLLGYSFGAWVGAHVAAGMAGLAALCLVAPPVEMLAFPALGGSGVDTLLLAGARDPYCSVAGLRRLAAGLPRAETLIIEGTDHFFSGALDPLGEAVATWAARWARR